jgi:hypothetical protein
MRSIAGLCSIVALAALVLAALSLPARGASLTGVACGSLLIWLIGIVTTSRREAPSRGVSQALVTGFLAVAVGLEAVAYWRRMADGDTERAGWFLSAGLYALAAIVTTWLDDPRDPAVVSQMGFHILILVPLAHESLFEVSGLFLPLVVLVAGWVILTDLVCNAARSHVAWLVLLGAQSAWILLAVRWTGAFR